MDYLKEVEYNDQWKDIVKSAGFEGEMNKRICQYAQHHILNESIYCNTLSGVGVGKNHVGPREEDYPKSTIVESLGVLRKLNDLSNVFFSDRPVWGETEYMKAKTFKTCVSFSDFNELAVVIGTDKAEDEYRNMMMTEMSNVINRYIDEGYKITFYKVVESIQKIIDPTAMYPKFAIFSRFALKPPGITMEDL